MPNPLQLQLRQKPTHLFFWQVLLHIMAAEQLPG
jgi:hypothetical protein